MARDYKSRTSAGRSKKKPSPVAWWKWLLIALSIAGFAWFLKSLSDSAPPVEVSQKTPEKKSAKPVAEKKGPPPIAKPTEPEFEFYQILEQKEVVVPEYETKTIAREEQVGKAKVSSYILQAGAFKDFKQADKRRAQLALLGIQSKVEKVGGWNRVKIGPYPKMSSVNRVSARLKKEGISVIVTRVGG